MKKKLLVVALVVAMIASVTACGGNEGTAGDLAESSGTGKETASESGIGSNPKEVEATLSLISEEEITVFGDTSDYFVVYSEEHVGEKDIVNAKGEVQVVSFAHTGILGDGYLVRQSYWDEEQGKYTLVLKDNEEILRINQDYVSGWDYYDGIFYYTDRTTEDNASKNKEAVAYDLIAGKELWRTEGESPSVQGDFIKLKNKYAIEIGDEKFYSKIVDLSGNTIAESTEEYDIYPTATNYYIKTERSECVEVYDFEGSKISALSLEADVSNISFELKQVLDNGMYIVMEYNDDTYDIMERLYDINGNMLKECTYMDAIGNNMVECNDMREGLYDSYLIINETGIVDEVWDVKSVASGVDKKYFAMVEKRDANGDYSTSSTHIYNLISGKYMVCNTKVWERFEQAPDGNYFIIKDEDASKWQVYSSDFEKLYEGTDDRLWPVNEEYVLEDGEKLSLIHIASGEKTELKVKGNHGENNRFGIVTYDGEKYYLYALEA